VNEPDLLSAFATPRELAAAFLVQPSTTRAWVLSRKIDFYRIHGTIRFDRSLVDPTWLGPRMLNQWCSKDDVATLLQVSRRTLEIWVKKGLFPVTAKYGCTVRFHRQRLFELLRRDFFFPAIT